jgi:pyridinium-3,5-bisthiocarboxylic acid mononucleotide nickel chelatase
MAEKRHVHVDLLGGLAGDMFLAAALDAGLVGRDEAQRVLRAVGLGPVEVVAKRVMRGAVEGTHVSFRGWDRAHDSDHRHLTTIREMLRGSELDVAVQDRALEMFERLGEAEAKVHGIEIERVHFHEVGAVDSILDFVAAAWILEEAQATWSFGKIPVGSGTIRTAHGEIPVPAPATARLLEGLPLVYREVEAELVTPTGAAILATLAEMPGERAGRLEGTGFGCGSRDLQEISNVARLVVLCDAVVERSGDALGQLEGVVQLSCEVDDESPEITAFVAERLMEEGALDVVREPVWMKKGRIGTRITVLCESADEMGLVEVLLVETTTLGVRRQALERWVMQREIRQVETPFGSVAVKVALRGGKVVKVSPEYASCAACARATGAPLREVFQAARTEAMG